MSDFSFNFGLDGPGGVKTGPASNFTFLPGGNKTVSNPQDGIGTSAQTKGGSFIDLVRDLAGIGRDIYVTKIQGELSENQVAAGQYPSTRVNASGNIEPFFGGGNSIGGLPILWIVAAGILVLLLARR